MLQKIFALYIYIYILNGESDITQTLGKILFQQKINPMSFIHKKPVCSWSAKKGI